MAFGSTLPVSVDSAEARKERGAFFTPQEIASFLARQLITSSACRVLEPSCGEAEFVLAACERLQRLGHVGSDYSNSICAYELHEQSACAASERLRANGFACTIATGDFLKSSPSNQFDVVLGNPPYVRFQVIDASQRAFQRELAARLGVDLSALSSTWAPFVLHSCEFLRAGGSLGLVLPAELLTVNYAAPVRSYLLHSFARVRLYTFEGKVFPEVQEEVVLLVAEGYEKGPTDYLEWHQCGSVRDLGIKGALRFEPKDVSARWSDGLAPYEARVLLDALADTGMFSELGQWGDLALGGVTGANSFFTLSPASAEDFGLVEGRDVVPICPPGSKHIRRRSLDADGLSCLSASGACTLLFAPSVPLSSEAQSYIRRGEELKLHERYKCRKRKPWWKVPLPVVPDVFITYMNAFGPGLCSNDAGVSHLNSCHGIRFAKELRELGKHALPMGSFNSATMLSAELVGRSYGGGIQKLEPREATKLLVPSPQLLEEARLYLELHSEEYDSLLAKREYACATALVDDVLLREVAGLSDTDMNTIADARKRLMERRANRSKGV